MENERRNGRRREEMALSEPISAPDSCAQDESIGQLRAEIAQLRRQNEELRLDAPLIAFAGKVGVLRTDENGGLLEINAAFCHLLGRSREEIESNLALRQSIMGSLWPPSKGPESIESQIGGSWRECALVRPDGGVVPVVLSAGRVADAPHQVIFYALEFEPHRGLEKARFQTEILASQDYVRVIAENLHEGVLLTDLDDVVLYANSHMAQMSGYETEEMLGRPAYQLFLPPEIWPVVIAQNQNRAQGQSGQYELLMQRKDGTPFWCLVNAAPLRNGRGEVVGTLGAQSDITARKEAELLQLQLASQLERSNAELQSFAYAVSHDLKEPLRKIEVFGSRLEGRAADALGEENRDYLRRMRAAARRMSDLIDGLLAYSRVTTGASGFERVDLSQIAREVLQDLEIEISHAQAHIELEKLPSVQADARQLRQLLQHLLSNALKFRRDDEKLQIRILNQSDDTRIAFAVADNGRGFTGEEAERIFEVFTRLEGRSSPEAADGSQNCGVGLSICRKIVERHGGSIEASGEVGAGAVFQVVLPRENGLGHNPGNR